jgi:MFS family permease
VSSSNTSKNLRFALWILIAINILNFYDRHVPGALTEPMRKEFGMTDTQVGLLGSAFIWIYAIVGVPLGRVADTWSRKKLLGGGMIIWSLLTAFAGLANSYSMLLFSRLGVGVGEAVAAPTATSWIGDLFPPEKRARALGLFMLGVPIGGALSYFFSGPIADAFGWRAAMVTAAVPAILLIPALFMVPEPVRGASETHKTNEVAGSMWSVLKIPTLLWIIASGALLNFNMYAIGTFLPAMLSRIHGLTVAQAGLATGVAYLFGGLAGGNLAGYIGDRIVHKRKDGRMLAAAIIAIVGAPIAYFGIIMPAGAVVAAVFLLALAYGALNTYYGLVYSSIQDIVPPSQRGSAMAIYFMAMYLCGASFGPLLTGKLSDILARQAMQNAGATVLTEAFKATGLQQAMLILPVLSILLAVVLWAGSKTITRDIERREEAVLAAQTASARA